MEVGLALLGGGFVAGVFGSLLGLGGGILIVPLLTIGFGLPLRDAVGVSLVCVIVTSSASAGVYLERRVANLRLGMLLELFTAMGAIVGGAIAFLVDQRVLAGLFTLMLLYVAITMARGIRAPKAATTASVAGSAGAAASAPMAEAAGVAASAESAGVAASAPAALAASIPAPASAPDPSPADRPATPSWRAALAGPDYAIRNLPGAYAGSIVAGVASALLGIGGGLVKVPVMHLIMGVPLRVATATSNLMIGITASTSAIVYLLRGGIDAYATGPTAIGVFLGAMTGSRLGHRVDLRLLRGLFVIVLLYTAYEMARRAAGLA